MKESDYTGYDQLFISLSTSIRTSTDRFILLTIYWLTRNGIKATRKNLSKYVGLSSRAIAWNLARLSKRGLVVKELHASEESGFLPTIYTLNEEAITDGL